MVKRCGMMELREEYTGREMRGRKLQSKEHVTSY
jgi:hypothetical protein